MLVPTEEPAIHAEDIGRCAPSPERSLALRRGDRKAAKAVKQLAKRGVAWTGYCLNGLLGSRSRRRVGILMYHRVADPVTGVEQPTWNVEPRAFRAQMAGLLARGFQAWSLRRLIVSRGQDIPFGAKIFVVTFDDGHESVYRNAWPMLNELRIPATVFLTTKFLDDQGPFPFDDWSAAGSDRVPRDTWRPMSTRQCLDMAADGLVELAVHTHTHRDFSACPNSFKSDLSLSVDVLRSRFGIENPSFAFPFGYATAAMMKTVQEAGCLCGLTTYGVLTDPLQSPFGWGRFDVASWDTAGTLAAKLSGWCSWAPQIRRLLTEHRKQTVA